MLDSGCACLDVSYAHDHVADIVVVKADLSLVTQVDDHLGASILLRVLLGLNGEPLRLASYVHGGLHPRIVTIPCPVSHDVALSCDLVFDGARL